MISVIITVYNEAGSIGALLDRLLAQSQPPDEIVVVDGGSTDGTVATLERYGTSHPIVRHRVEAGANIARGRNLAIDLARGDILAVTDAGCAPDLRWLEELVRPLLEDASLDAVGGRFVIDSRSRFEHYAGKLSLPDPDAARQSGMFYGRSSAFRRDLWERVGGYPDWLYTAEDTLFAMRAKALGFRAVYAKDAIVHWRPRPTLRKLAKMFYLYGRGQGRINIASLPGVLYWLKYYVALLVFLVLGAFQPLALLGAIAILAYLARILVWPNYRKLAADEPPGEAAHYIAPIVVARNLFSNLGQLHGYLEYRWNPFFRERLAQYSRSVPAAI